MIMVQCGSGQRRPRSQSRRRRCDRRCEQRRPVQRLCAPRPDLTQPLNKPEYDWECIDFLVNEGPAFLFHENKIYITYSASGTGVPYAVGLLTAERGSDLLNKDSWTKSPVPVFKTCAENGQYGPGHNSFTKSEDDSEDLMIYHCRNYTEIKGDPLFDPNRHARVGVVKWTENGPDFGVPEPDNLWTPDTTDVLPADGGALAGTPVAN